MGQKVNPIGLRIGINKDWDSKWFVNKKKYGETLHEDLQIRDFIENKLKNGGIAKVQIQRTNNQVIINIHSSKPGVIIGGQGKKIDELRGHLEKKFSKQFNINVLEVKKPQMNAALVADNVSRQVEARISYRRAVKMAIDKAIEAGAIGVKIKVAGRLNGVEIARSEFFSKGKIPLHTLRADIDYSTKIARTTYGAIGVKVWIYKGDVFN